MVKAFPPGSEKQPQAHILSGGDRAIPERQGGVELFSTLIVTLVEALKASPSEQILQSLPA